MEKNLKKLYQTISNQMGRLRNERKYSQSTIARALGVTQTTYGRYESNAIHISAAQLYQLSRFYKVDVRLFFTDDVVQQNEAGQRDGELQVLKESNDVLVPAKLRLMDGDNPLEDDFIQMIVDYLIKRQLLQ